MARILVTGFLVIAFVAALVRVHAAADGSKTPTVVGVDFPGKAAVIGRLGLPLGEVATIRGRWRKGDAHEEPFIFQVTSVNGKHLAEPAEFVEVRPQSYLLPVPGFEAESGESEVRRRGEWEIRGWESGQFLGIPTSAVDAWRTARKTSGQDVPFRSGKISLRFEPRLEYFQKRIVK